jgi:hypothetical protein
MKTEDDDAPILTYGLYILIFLEIVFMCCVFYFGYSLGKRNNTQIQNIDIVEYHKFA